MRAPVRSTLSLCLFTLALGGCAAQNAAVRASNGLSVTLSPEPKCLSKGTGKSPLSDAQLCQDFSGSFARELQRVGFTVASGAAPAPDLNLVVTATQEMAADAPAAALSIDVRIKKGTDELEVEGAQTEELTSAGASDKVAELARQIAEDMADSPRLHHKI
jgi:hypothetical protein